MKLLEDRIVADGRILPGDVLKVDSFINHQIDVQFVCQLGKEFFRRFEGCGVTKILTIEASGIGIACLTAQYFGVPVVFAKKSTTSNLGNDVYATTVDSYTHGRTYDVLVSKRYLSPEDRVLVIDGKGKCAECADLLGAERGRNAGRLRCRDREGVSGGRRHDPQPRNPRGVAGAYRVYERGGRHHIPA